jgi:hypothetical protein
MKSSNKLRLEKAKQFKLVEKANHLAVHGLFGSRQSAETFLRDTVPVYLAKSYYMDKTLTVNSFEVIET